MLASYLLPYADLPTALTAKADDELPTPKYGKAYTIENLLTDYNLVAKEDLMTDNHIVVGFLVGGKLEVGSHGDATRSDSYAHEVINTGNFNKNSMLRSNQYADDADDFKFYYEIGSPVGDSIVQIGEPYFEAKDAFDAVELWSREQAKNANAWRVQKSDLNAQGILTIVVDESTPLDIVVPAPLVPELRYINFTGPLDSAIDVSDVATAGFTITIEGKLGTEEQPLVFNTAAELRNLPPAGSGIGIGLNGDKIENKLKDLEGSEEGGQVNLYGMNLVWNLPEAEHVETIGLSGHIVAPKATVTMSGSNGEGGIIAKNINLHNEIHFYSYRPNTSVIADTDYAAELYKYDSDEKALGGAILGAFPVNDGVVATKPQYKLKTEKENPNLLGLNAGKYVIKEFRAPAGYQIDDAKYYIEIIEDEDAKGQVNAALSNDTWSGDGANSKLVDYNGRVTVRVYEDENFTKVIDEASYSPLAVAENSYRAADRNFEFSVDENGEVTKVYEVKEDGTRTDVTAAELENFVFTPVEIASEPKTYTVIYNGESIVAENGLYNIDGAMYHITIGNDGTVESVIKKGEALSSDEMSKFRFGQYVSTGWMGRWENTDTLYYYNSAESTEPSDSAKAAPGSKEYTFNTLGKTYIVETERGYMGAPGSVKSMVEKDSPAPTTLVDVIETTLANYIVVYNGEVASANIKLSEKLEEKFEFHDDVAFTLTKVDAADETIALTGASFVMVNETYTERTADGETTYECTDSKTADDSDSVEGFSWDSNESETAFKTTDIHRTQPVRSGSGVYSYPNIYRIQETQAPKGYLTSANDILIVAGWNNMTRTKIYFTKEVRRGEAPTSLPVDNRGNVKDPADHDWTELDISKAADSSFVVGNKRDNTKIQLAKIDEETNAYVSGAKLELWKKDGTKALSEITTVNSATLLMDGSDALELQPGTYYVVETEVPAGYESDLVNVKQYFTVNADQTVTLGAPNTIEAEASETEENKRFTLCDGEGNVLADGAGNQVENVTRVTMKVSARPGGVYVSLLNSSADLSLYEFPTDTVTKEGMTAEYDPEKGTLTLTFAEAVTLIKAEVAEYNSGAFKVSDVVYECEGKSEWVGDPKIQLDPSGTTVTVKLPNKAKSVDNKLIFTKADDGYRVSAARYDTYSTIRKGSKITGAKMKLTYQNDASLENVTANTDFTLEGKTLKWTVGETDIEFSKLPNGTYILEEEEAPALYQPIDKVEIVVANTGVTVANADAANTKAVPVFVTNSGAKYTLTVYDSVYSVGIRKTDKNDMPIPGAVLELTGKNDKNEAIDLSNVKARDTQFFLADGSGKNNGTNYLLQDDENLIRNMSASSTAYRWQSIGSAVVFTGLPEGTYTIKEVETPLGFLPTEKTFTVKRNAETKKIETIGKDEANDAFDTVTLTDESVTLSISKEDMGGTSLDGATFTLEKLDENDQKTSLGNLAVSASGEKIEGIETSVAHDEDGNNFNDKAVTIEAFSATTYEIRGNTLHHVKVNGEALLETDETAPVQNVYVKGGAIEGNKLEITGLCDGTYVIALSDGREYTVRVDQKSEEVTSVSMLRKAEIKDDVLTFRGGKVDISSLSDGKYRLTETAAPKEKDGVEYEITVSAFTFEVHNGKVVSVSATTDGDTEEEIAEANKHAEITDDQKTLKIKDEKKRYSFQLDKKDTEDSTIEHLAGATFVLTPNGDGAAIDKRTVVKQGKTVIAQGTDTSASLSFQSSGDGALTISGLLPGKYKLEETAAPTAKKYLKAEGELTFKIGKDGLVVVADETTVPTTKPADQSGYYAASGSLITFYNTVKEDNTIEVQDAPTTLTISKTDLGAKPVPETNKATFKLTAKDKDANLDGVKVEGKTLTDKDTEVTFKGNKAEITGLKDGKYALEETVAPDGFVTITTFEFEIKDGKVVTESVKTESTGNVIVSKDGKPHRKRRRQRRKNSPTKPRPLRRSHIPRRKITTRVQQRPLPKRPSRMIRPVRTTIAPERQPRPLRRPIPARLTVLRPRRRARRRQPQRLQPLRARLRLRPPRSVLHRVPAIPLLSH